MPNWYTDDGSPVYIPLKLLVMLLSATLPLLFPIAEARGVQEEPIPLSLTGRNIHQATLTPTGEGSIEITTTGSDPYIYTENLAHSPHPERHYILEFEYFSLTGTDRLQVFVLPPLREEFSITSEGLPQSQGWSRFTVNLASLLERCPEPVTALRLDFGTQPGKTVRLRNLRLRHPEEQERRLAAQRQTRRLSDKKHDAWLAHYLGWEPESEILQVELTPTLVRVRCRLPGKTLADADKGTWFLAEFAPEENLEARVRVRPAALHSLQPAKPASGGTLVLEIARQDRLLSRWALVSKQGEGYRLESRARYADSVTPRAQLPEARPRNKKGIGALAMSRPLRDLDALDISAATINIVLNGLFSAQDGKGGEEWIPFSSGGRTWYASKARVADLDATVKEAAKRKMVVSAILLIGQGGGAPEGSFERRVAHPDADPSGIFVMPNLTDSEGVRAYAAALDFLAERYSRPEGEPGRIHHWILHNEVNAGWVWTNAGEKTARLYMDLYQKSLRMTHLIARQYDPRAKTFISLEHHWNIAMQPAPGFYKGRELLELLTRFSRAEGDFDWGIAFHPYPQNLFDPAVWADTEAQFTFDTPKITFKNLEVLDAWVRKPENRYLGKTPRTVHLSEQGLNSRDYSENALQEQAAGMAYAWNKLKHLSTIQVFHYHNWQDNRGEGGLRIGLRRFPDDSEAPDGRKPIWFVYQALGTPREQEALAPYLKAAGVSDWAEVRYRGAIR